MELSQRIARLEALEAIRQLKHRYLNACDLKEVERIRECFAQGPIDIDFGLLGRFTNRDDFIELYRSLACSPRVIDSHHGANPEIELLSDDEAQGRWALSYFNLDAGTGATRRLGVIYQDRYRRVDGQWQMVASHSRIIAEVCGQHLAPAI